MSTLGDRITNTDVRVRRSLLETLNLSRNKISVLVGAEKLQSLALLNLGERATFRCSELLC